MVKICGCCCVVFRGVKLSCGSDLLFFGFNGLMFILSSVSSFGYVSLSVLICMFLVVDVKVILFVLC